MERVTLSLAALPCLWLRVDVASPNVQGGRGPGVLPTWYLGADHGSLLHAEPPTLVSCYWTSILLVCRLVTSPPLSSSCSSLARHLVRGPPTRFLLSLVDGATR